jgi:hypothetical protein
MIASRAPRGTISRTASRRSSGLPERTEALPYPQALTHAIITDPRKIPAETRERLDLIVGHLLPRVGG